MPLLDLQGEVPAKGRTARPEVDLAYMENCGLLTIFCHGYILAGKTMAVSLEKKE